MKTRFMIVAELCGLVAAHSSRMMMMEKMLSINPTFEAWLEIIQDDCDHLRERRWDIYWASCPVQLDLPGIVLSRTKAMNPPINIVVFSRTLNRSSAISDPVIERKFLRLYPTTRKGIELGTGSSG